MEIKNPMDGLSVLGFISISLLFYILGLVIYRLFLHPLASVPGPKLAALSRGYEFWYDCIHAGKMSSKVREMHASYGPAVRISPNHVHIDDPAYFDILYNNTMRLNRDPFYYRMFGSSQNVIGTMDVDLHRTRRSALNKYFSTANVNRLEPRLESLVAKIHTLIEKHREAGKIINLSDVMRAYATDVVVNYILGPVPGLLDSPDIGAKSHAGLRGFIFILPWQRQFPWLLPTMSKYMRARRSTLTNKEVPTKDNPHVFNPQRDMQAKAAEFQQRMDKQSFPDAEHDTVFRTLFESPNLSNKDRELDRVVAEAQNIIGAGRETTGSALSALCYHLLSDEAALAKLKEELKEAEETSATNEDDVLSSSALEKLPYLQAVIKEALRMSPLTGRISRLHPTATLSYTPQEGPTYSFPPGTVLSMSAPDIVFNPQIYPEPDSFSPERWLEDGSDRKDTEMEKKLVVFWKGPMNCIGQELARRQMLLIVGNVFRKYDFTLVDTSREDIKVEHDLFMGIHGKNARGVRVKVDR